MNFQDQTAVQERYGRLHRVIIISLGCSEGDLTCTDGSASIVQKEFTST
jgi:hypothetical protein